MRGAVWAARRHSRARYSSRQCDGRLCDTAAHSVPQLRGVAAPSPGSSACHIWSAVVLLGLCFSAVEVEGSDVATVLPIGGEANPAYALPAPREVDYDRTISTGLDFQEGNMLQALGDSPPTETEEPTKDKKWTDPEDRARARILYNYLMSRRMGNELFGKRMGSSFPTKNFRFFTSAYKGNGGLHGSEFLGKRGQVPVSEFLGKRARVSEFLGKRSKASEFLGKRAGISEFLGKRARISEFLGKRARVSEFLGKRARVSDFLGSDSPEIPEKRARVSEFLGKRAGASEFLGKQARVSEFLGKRSDPMNLSSKRARISEFLGKRGVGYGAWVTRPRERVSEFLGKRDGGDAGFERDRLGEEEDSEPQLEGSEEEYQTMDEHANSARSNDYNPSGV